ncbi:nad-dependent 15-hydroxyprostaglandin dehydrogenase [Phlyctema vagabunda]|uniref:Nad-dependent 15-hydroxyprostaglandin dehydrogenase n=1 Tax=Phlyctema vagabunda TaxID=108571 RepID=A0ABR4PJ87_9HELO
MSLGDFTLLGKIAVITGVGSGINLSFSQHAVNLGARVIIADLKLTEDGEKFPRETDSKVAVFAKCDVTKRADLENLVLVSVDKFQDTPDVWVAGAGIFEPSWSNFWDDTEEDGYALIDINVNHPIKFSRIAIRTLLGNGKKGVILCVSSLAGFQGTLSVPLYCASKHAVVGFVRSMAELDRLEGIKAVAIAPGVVRTPLWTDHPDKMKQFGYSMENTIPPEDIAKTMIEAVTSGSIPGGYSVSISTKGTALLGTWNIAAPKDEGTTVSPTILEMNYAPVIATMNKERAKSR